MAWCGFVGSWGCRLLALVTIVIGIGTGLGLGAAAGASVGLVGLAEAASAAAAVARLLVHVFGCHLYCTAYPRDVSLLPAVAYAVAFERESQRLNPKSADEIVESYKHAHRWQQDIH